MKEVYETAKSVRDAFADLLMLFDSSPVKHTLSNAILLKAVEDWDDLAEDCLIASDPDIRASINRIADLC